MPFNDKTDVNPVQEERSLQVRNQQVTGGENDLLVTPPWERLRQYSDPRTRLEVRLPQGLDLGSSSGSTAESQDTSSASSSFIPRRGGSSIYINKPTKKPEDPFWGRIKRLFGYKPPNPEASVSDLSDYAATMASGFGSKHRHFTFRGPEHTRSFIDSAIDSYIQTNPEAASKLESLRNTAQKDLLADIMSKLPEDQWNPYLSRVINNLMTAPEGRVKLMRELPKELPVSFFEEEMAKNLSGLLGGALKGVQMGRTEEPSVYMPREIGGVVLINPYAIKDRVIEDKGTSIDLSKTPDTSQDVNKFDIQEYTKPVLYHEMTHILGDGVTWEVAPKQVEMEYERTLSNPIKGAFIKNLSIDSPDVEQRNDGWYLTLPNGDSLKVASSWASRQQVQKRLDYIKEVLRTDQVGIKLIEQQRFVDPNDPNRRTSLALVVVKTTGRINRPLTLPGGRELPTTTFAKVPSYFVIGSVLCPSYCVDVSEASNMKNKDKFLYNAFLSDLASQEIKLALNHRHSFRVSSLVFNTTLDFVGKMQEKYNNSLFDDGPFLSHEVFATLGEMYMTQQAISGKPVLNFEDFVRAVRDNYEYRQKTGMGHVYSGMLSRLYSEADGILKQIESGRPVDYSNTFLYYAWSRIFSSLAKDQRKKELQRIQGTV